MTDSDGSHEIYVEVGQKKVFAAAVHWPGWCRVGKDEALAVRPRFTLSSIRHGRCSPHFTTTPIHFNPCQSLPPHKPAL